MKFIKPIIALILMFGVLPASAQFTTGNSRGGSAASGEDYALTAGYKGYVEFGYGIGVGDFGEGRVELQTTHGYQFNPYLFAGVGIGASYYHEGEAWNVPIYADLRGNLPIAGSKVSPFVDFKIGYSVADIEGFYFAPSVGVRFAVGEKTGLNISLGYEMQKWSYEFGYGGYYYEGSENTGAVAIKIGLDF